MRHAFSGWHVKEGCAKQFLAKQKPFRQLFSASQVLLSGTQVFFLCIPKISNSGKLKSRLQLKTKWIPYKYFFPIFFLLLRALAHSLNPKQQSCFQLKGSSPASSTICTRPLSYRGSSFYPDSPLPLISSGGTLPSYSPRLVTIGREFSCIFRLTSLALIARKWTPCSLYTSGLWSWDMRQSETADYQQGVFHSFRD